MISLRPLIRSLFLFLTGFSTLLLAQPEGYEQIIPRGRLAAITEPVFVAAAAAEIAAETWVLGVYVNGEARAYSLNLLNAHEIVNDFSGDLKFAAVW